MTYDVTQTITVPDGSGGTITLNAIAADGVTNDRTALQAFIDYAHSNGGGEILLPGNRVIRISSALIFYSNLSFRSLYGRAVIKPFNDESYAFMSAHKNTTTNEEDPSYNVTIEGIDFDGEDKKFAHGLIFFHGSNIQIRNCTFKNFGQTKEEDANGYSAIHFLGSMSNVDIKGCTFDTIKGGIFFNKRNYRIRIEDNQFNNLIRHAIHLQGSQKEQYYCSDVIIRGNYIKINQQPQREYGTHGIYITCGDVNFDGISSHHENVTIADNTIIGPAKSFPQGFGAADLFSLKDIIRLKCYGNTARNGGDLGYAIERCHFGVVSNNTADQNNRCGISIFGSSHISVTGNVCGNNEKDHGGHNTNAPYGGIRVEFDSKHVILIGNYLYDSQAVSEASQQYGIVVKSASVPSDVPNNTRSPYHIKIGTNHYSGNVLGDIFNDITSTIIQDASATVLP